MGRQVDEMVRIDTGISKQQGQRFDHGL